MGKVPRPELRLNLLSFLFKCLCEIKVRFENALEYQKGAQIGRFSEQIKGVKIS